MGRGFALCLNSFNSNDSHDNKNSLYSDNSHSSDSGRDIRDARSIHGLIKSLEWPLECQLQLFPVHLNGSGEVALQRVLQGCLENKGSCNESLY